MRLVFELAAVARFYAAPEGTSTLRKILAFNAATAPAIRVALLVWAGPIANRIRPKCSAGEASR